MGLTTLQDGVTSISKKGAIAIALGAASVGVGVGVGASAIAGAIKRRKAKRRKTRSSGKRGNRNKKRRTKYARTAGKRKDTSHRRIRMTKNGQPYVILASGKARFISKRSAKTSRKRKGGRY